MTNLKYKLTSPVLMWAIIIVGGIILWRVVPGGRLFNSGIFGAIILALGAINWAYVLFKSASVHKKAPASVNSIDKLITEGMYAVVRHPIYAADIVLFWCLFLFYPVNQMLGLAVWATISLLFWVSLEERMLEEKFLEDYRLYKQRVPMLIPRFRK